MQVGAIGYQPYIYNTNTVDRASMNRVQAIPEDINSQKTDYSGLVSGEQGNINRLRRGESANFADIIQSQMQMSQNNANRIMKPAEPEVIPATDQMAVNGGGVDLEATVMTDTADMNGLDSITDEMDGLVGEKGDMAADGVEVAIGTGADTNIDELATGEEAVTNMEEASVGTGAAPRPYDTGEADDNGAVSLKVEETVRDSAASPGNSPFGDLISRFQMRRASEAYAFSMGL